MTANKNIGRESYKPSQIFVKTCLSLLHPPSELRQQSKNHSWDGTPDDLICTTLFSGHSFFKDSFFLFNSIKFDYALFYFFNSGLWNAMENWNSSKWFTDWSNNLDSKTSHPLRISWILDKIIELQLTTSLFNFCRFLN